MATAVNQTCKMLVPGQKICSVTRATSDSNKYIAKSGKGTYEKDGIIYSSLVGQLLIQKYNCDMDEDGMRQRIMEVHGLHETVVPCVDDIVTVRVMSVNPRFCRCSIIGLKNNTLRDTFRGVIRSEDVRKTEKDRVDMSKSFRPGDIVIAKVISLGDSQSFLLSTAMNEFGVVVALSEAGVKMVPISWCEMQCPVTYVKQYRKVAKVQAQFIEGVNTETVLS